MITDPTIARIGQGVELHHGRGQREAARHMVAQIWDEIGGEQGDTLHVCVLAHSMAGVQGDVRQELVWDQRALAAANHLTEDWVAKAGVTLSVAGLYPSLHLNLGECYRKLGDLSRAREHVTAGVGAAGIVRHLPGAHVQRAEQVQGAVSPAARVWTRPLRRITSQSRSLLRRW